MSLLLNFPPPPSRLNSICLKKINSYSKFLHLETLCTQYHPVLCISSLLKRLYRQGALIHDIFTKLLLNTQYESQSWRYPTVMCINHLRKWEIHLILLFPRVKKKLEPSNMWYKNSWRHAKFITENVITEIIKSQNIRSGRESFYNSKIQKKIRKIDQSAVTWISGLHKNVCFSYLPLGSFGLLSLFQALWIY